VRKTLVAVLAAGAAHAALPSGATADEQEYSFRIPITVSGYQVKQTVVGGPRPPIDGHITKMNADVVDADCANVNTCPESDQVPIDRLMLHHIVFINIGRWDQTCHSGIVGFDGLQVAPGYERFFAAGEERARLAMPPGYGYELGSQGSNPWAVLYMVMNHRADSDSAFIEYNVTVEDGQNLEEPVQDAVPFWLDAENCQADPIYNVPGTGDGSATDRNVRDFTVEESKLGAPAGRIVAGAGHVHGGAEKLKLSQPSCGDRRLATSVPTWGRKDHPFYNVRPILHEPGPINMTAFEANAGEEGIPIRAGQPLRLSSLYDNTRPHTRVMGIMIVFIAPDESVPVETCSEPVPDMKVSERPDGRTKGPVKFEVPLTGLDEDGQAVEISAPPGKLKDVKSGATLGVGDNFFKRKNVRIERGDELTWEFATNDLHNLTLANGPRAIGSPNLSRDNDGKPRNYTRRFNRSGTYRLFCALHPVQMSERVVVKP
jgi:plastocyanin